MDTKTYLWFTLLTIATFFNAFIMYYSQGFYFAFDKAGFQIFATTIILSFLFISTSVIVLTQRRVIKKNMLRINVLFAFVLFFASLLSRIADYDNDKFYLRLLQTIFYLLYLVTYMVYAKYIYNSLCKMMDNRSANNNKNNYLRVQN